MKNVKCPDQVFNSMVVPGVYIGKLMSPAEVAQATAGEDPGLYRGLVRWTLCGDVAPALFDLLQASHMSGGSNERITMLSSPAGHSYVVLTRQWHCFQHRYFLPLFDQRAKECIESISRDGELGYSLAGEGSDTLVWRSVVGPQAFLPLRSKFSTVAEGEEEAALEDYARALDEVGDPGRIPSVLDDEAVRFASVSAINPAEIVMRLMRRYGVST